jgi:hypothetical protein
VEGEEIETIAGHLSLRHPISPKPDLIKDRGKEGTNLPTFTFEWVIEDAKAYLGLERSP